MFRPLAEKKNIDLRAQFAAGMPAAAAGRGQVAADPVNLLSNAIKFTPEGGRVLLKADVGRDCTSC